MVLEVSAEVLAGDHSSNRGDVTLAHTPTIHERPAEGERVPFALIDRDKKTK